MRASGLLLLLLTACGRAESPEAETRTGEGSVAPPLSDGSCDFSDSAMIADVPSTGGGMVIITPDDSSVAMPNACAP